MSGHLQSSGQLQKNTVSDALSITTNRVIIPLIIIDCIAETNFFFENKHTTAERITQAIDDWKFSC